MLVVSACSMIAGLAMVILLTVRADDVRAEPSSYLRLEILAIVYTDTFTKRATDEELDRLRSLGYI